MPNTNAPAKSDPKLARGFAQIQKLVADLNTRMGALSTLITAGGPPTPTKNPEPQPKKEERPKEKRSARAKERRGSGEQQRSHKKEASAG